MDPIISEPAEPLVSAPKRRFFGRIGVGVSQPPWSRRAAALAVLISFGGFYGLPELFDSASHGLPELILFWPNLIWALPMLGSLVYLTRQSGTSVGTVFGLRGAPISRLLVSALLLCFLDFVLTVVVTMALTPLGFEDGPADFEEAKDAASSFFLFTNDTVWVPIGEELWFRGLLYTSLRTCFGVAPSAFVTAALFSAVHLPNTLVWAATLFFSAILSSLWYERTRSLWPNVLAHSLHNTLVTVLHAGG